MHLSKILLIAITAILLTGCASNPWGSANNAEYFTDPALAVEKITVMLREKDWPQLAKYYDLSDSPIDRSTLISGEFFYTDQRPKSAHPGGFWRYKHPFSPAFKFHSIRELEESGVIEVTVEVEIDQGGGMIQRGMQTFLMRKTSKGYKVMPHKSPVR